MTNGRKIIYYFNEAGVDDVPLVGGRNAWLGEMYRRLTPQVVKVPNGFATIADPILMDRGFDHS